MSAVPMAAPQRDGYQEFLESKFKFKSARGFRVELADLHPSLIRHQPIIVQWALAGGCRALFAKFGLGKTVMQLEIMRQIALREGGYQLIILPLGVRQEFMRDAIMLGMEPVFIRRTEEIGAPGLYLTNYESVRDGKLDISRFNAASLDEAAVLRSFGSLTYQTFLPLFAETKYRFVCTATPSPNRYKELIHYAGFLGIADTGQSLTRYFQRDSKKANNLTLYPHMQREFFTWLHSWACFIQLPSDLGFSDEGYDLPPMRIHWHEVKVGDLTGGVDRDGQGILIRDPAMGLSEAAKAKRDSMGARIAKVKELCDAEPRRHAILWHDLEDERHAIMKAIPAALEVFGSQDYDERERRTIGFSDGEFQYLATKASISGSGSNFQRFCSMSIFAGVGFEFADLIQACHRVQRYGQTKTVDIHIIYSELERGVRAIIERKWAEHDALAKTMGGLLREYGLSTDGLERELARTIGVKRRVVSSALFEAAHNDCVDECRRMPSNSVDLIVSSIPFGTQYEYCESYNDFGHNQDNAAFWRQMDHLTPELLRILAPGRVAAIHVKDRVLFGNVTGYGMPSIEPFHADCIAHFRRHGFIYFGAITILTDVVRENNQTYRLGWTENAKDSTKMGVGCPEYVLLFRKLPTNTSKGYADKRVTKEKPLCYPIDIDDDEYPDHSLDLAGEEIPDSAWSDIGVPFDNKLRPVPGTGYSRARWQIDAHALWRSSGDRLLTLDELKTLGPDKLASAFPKWSLQQPYDYEGHVAIGEALDETHRLPSTFGAILPGSWHPDVWHDINRMLTLNGEQSQKGREQHVCPLQKDIVDRLITRFSSPGELVFDPFGGIGTVPVQAVASGRRGKMSELHPGYFKDAVSYLRAAEAEVQTPSLFDLLGAA